MRTKNWIWMSFLCVALFLSGCVRTPTTVTVSLTVNSEPSEARIYVGGAYWGKAPVKLSYERPVDSDFFEGTFVRLFQTDKITVLLDGYEPQTKQFTFPYDSSPKDRQFAMLFVLEPIEPPYRPQQQQQQQMMGSTIVIGGKLVTGEEALEVLNFGTVKFDSTPQQAEVLIEGNSIGFTPTSHLRFQVGTYNVRIIKIGYKPWERKIMVIQDSSITINPQLEPVE